MGTVGAVATAVGVGLQIVDKYIDDPTRRLKARQALIDGIKEQMNDTLTTQDMEELDKFLLDFISSLHNLQLCSYFPNYLSGYTNRLGDSEKGDIEEIDGRGDLPEATFA